MSVGWFFLIDEQVAERRDGKDGIVEDRDAEFIEHREIICGVHDLDELSFAEPEPQRSVDRGDFLGEDFRIVVEKVIVWLFEGAGLIALDEVKKSLWHEWILLYEVKRSLYRQM